MPAARNSSAMDRTSRVLAPVKASAPDPPLDPELDEFDAVPVTVVAVVGVVTVNGCVKVWAWSSLPVPVSVTVCAPAGTPAGTANVPVTLPVPSAVSWPSSIGSELNVTVTSDAGFHVSELTVIGVPGGPELGLTCTGPGTVVVVVE